jgi:hypothetical protein
MRGFRIIAFLLKRYLNTKMVSAIYRLFTAIRTIELAVDMIESILLNLKLWLFAPIAFQLETSDAVVPKLETKDGPQYIEEFNISKIYL